MADELKVIQSTGSASTFIVSGTKNRAYIKATGIAAGDPKVNAELKRIRTGACDWATAEWSARMLAKTY